MVGLAHGPFGRRGTVFASLLMIGGMIGAAPHELLAQRDDAKPVPTRSCASAIYSTSIRPGATPAATNAVTVGHAIFNDLRDARTHLTRPSRQVPYYTYKSPLTVWAAATVTVTVRSKGQYAKLLYAKPLIDRLGSTTPPSWEELPAATRLGVCKGADGRREATQYNGGFALLHPGCITISVLSPTARAQSQIVPFGVARCGRK